MNDLEALAWCRDHSIVAIFHRKRIILAVPYKRIDVTAFKDAGFRLEMRDGFALAVSDPEDAFNVVVEAARAAWVSKLSPVDTVAEAINKPVHSVVLDFRENML